MRIKIKVFAAAVCCALSLNAFGDVASAKANFLKKYPATTIKDVQSTPIPGLYAFVLGKNVWYFEENGKYAVVGTLFDVETQTDMTKGLKEAASRIEPGKAWEKNAIVSVQGNGSRKLYVFTDPDCPFCSRLENTLPSLKDVTIYRVLYPIASLHPNAHDRSVAIWCAGENEKRLDAFMSAVKGGQVAVRGECTSPVDENVKLGEAADIHGTPTMVSGDGRVLAGALPLADIEKFIEGPNPK